MEELELLLQQQTQKIKNYENRMKRQTENSTIQKADANADIKKFMSMINKIVSIVMKNLDVSFETDEGKEDFLESDNPINHNLITYKLIERVPKGELKPREREAFTEKDGDRFGEVYGQKFKCYVQFNIFGQTAEEAEKILDMFEEILFSYTGYFKKNGVNEIIFDKQFTDDYYKIYRQKFSIRNLRYYVEIEKLRVIFKEKIQEIQALLSDEEEI